MTFEELKKIAAGGDSGTVEFRKSTGHGCSAVRQRSRTCSSIWRGVAPPLRHDFDTLSLTAQRSAYTPPTKVTNPRA